MRPYALNDKKDKKGRQEEGHITIEGYGRISVHLV